MRSRWMFLLAGLVTMVFVAPAVAHAQDTGPGEVPEGVGIGDAIYLTGATITPLEGGEEERTFDDYDAAVYVQSWLGCAFLCGPEASAEPPSDLPVYRVDSSGSWNGSVGTVTSYFATDGTTAYVAFPGLVVWVDPAQVPPPDQWFIAPARTIDAFNGEAELEDTTGTQTATSIPGSADPVDEPTSDATDESSGPPVPLLVGGAAVLVVLLVGALLWRRRRGSEDDSTPTEPEPVDSAAR